MPEEGVPFRSHESVLRIEEIADFTRRAVKAGIRRVRLTGGEPLVRKGVVDLIREINDIPEIEDISLTTNGILLPKMAPELREAGLTRVNISLDTLDPAQFSYVTRLGKIEDVFAGHRCRLRAWLRPRQDQRRRGAWSRSGFLRVRQVDAR